MRRQNMLNINQLTALELRTMCTTANTRLRDECIRMGFDEYPYISITHSTPQQKRGWLLYHFPGEFYNGRTERGAIGGHRRNRGVVETTNGCFYDADGAKVAGMKQ